MQGHMARLCKKNIKNNITETTITCQLCSRPGHSANKCHLMENKKPINETNVNTCQLCLNTEHTVIACKNNIACFYCKGVGYTIDECRKRIYNANRKAGNGQSSLNSSAPQGTQNIPQRSTHTAQAQEFSVEELIALNSSLHPN